MSLSNILIIRLLQFLALSFGMVAYVVSISGMATDNLNYFKFPLTNE